MAHQTQTSLTNLLLDYLEELTEDELRKFKFNLIHLEHEEYQPIPRGQVEKLDRTDLADKMISSYNEDAALNVMLEMLKKMNLNNLVQKLNKDLQKRPKAGSERGDIPEQTHRRVVSNQSAVEFVDQHRKAIIKKVSLIDPILDDLHEHISGEKCNNIRAASTDQEKMRRLYVVLNSNKLKKLFFDSLKENESSLVSELERS